MRSYNGQSPELSPELRQTRDLETFVQDIKVIDISRRSIQSYTKRLPFMIAGAVVAGIPFALSILGLSILFALIFGSIFAAVLSQIIGPKGAYESRRKAREVVAERLEALKEKVPEIRQHLDPMLIGFQSVSKSNIRFCTEGFLLDEELISKVDEDGAWPIGSCKFSGVVLRRPEGQIDASDRGLAGQYWMNEIRAKAHSAEAMNDALNTQVRIASP
ncbi:MAG: hypothetical protein AAGJ32_08535 [Pseudomonadota bacterium]